VIVGFAWYAIRGYRGPRRQTPYESYDSAEGDRHEHGWGYRDTRFVFTGPRTVHVTGRRYPIAGYPMPHFIDFVEDALGVSVDPNATLRPREDDDVSRSRCEESLLTRLRGVLSEDQISLDSRTRVAHSHGQLSVDEVYRVLYRAPLDRVVDVVVFPESESQLRGLVDISARAAVCLIPYGGGTNVTGALLCDPNESRTIVSVDMRRMNRVLWLDEENLTACAQSGITGKALEAALRERGYTCGHEPDSVEFSTLGGWISTNASGMRRSRYGNIEDIVLDISVITPTGSIGGESAFPRVSAGARAQSLLFGSEGNLGIIASAVVKIRALPEARQYASVVFPSFEQGLAFLRSVKASGSLPASIRLVSNTEFRFGQALRAQGGPGRRFVALLQRAFLLRVLRFDPHAMAACTIVFEGSLRDVRRERRHLMRLGRVARGVSGGARNGQRGFALTFGIAYIRDFLNQLNVLGETLETSAPWSRIAPLCEAVERVLHEQCKAYGVRGRPYLGTRVTQIYGSGVCLYFTVGISADGLGVPEDVFASIERKLRRTILDQGGSLSHHHGVGKVRRSFVGEVQSPSAARALRAVKAAIDPGNVFGAANGVFFVDEQSETRHPHLVEPGRPGRSARAPAPES
jgi:alkyldihydroxyacetonephosphate synthase